MGSPLFFKMSIIMLHTLSVEIVLLALSKNICKEISVESFVSPRSHFVFNTFEFSGDELIGVSLDKAVLSYISIMSFRKHAWWRHPVLAGYHNHGATWSPIDCSVYRMLYSVIVQYMVKIRSETVLPVKPRLVILTLSYKRTTDLIWLRRLKNIPLYSEKAIICPAFSFSNKLIKYIDQQPVPCSQVCLRYLLQWCY